MSHDGRNYDPLCIDFFVCINGVYKQISSRTTTATYTVNDAVDEIEVYAVYCNHGNHNNVIDETDLASQPVKIKIKPNYVSTPEELKALANTNNYYVLGANIDLSGESNWTPIEGFKGTLSGGGYSISNLTVNSLNGENIGLFGVLEGTVRNLAIENAQITARGNAGKAGIVAGTNKGGIENVTVSGDITLPYYDYVGGLAGYCENGSVINCINRATVTGANNVGGLVGYMAANKQDAVTGCKNEGIITGKDQVGGIAGYIKASSYNMQNNENANTVSGVNSVGGIFGEVYGAGELSLLTNTAEITGGANGNYTGGLVGKAASLKIMATCDNTGDITGGCYVGGFVGYAPDTNIKAMGTVNTNTITGKGVVGGFAGQAGLIEYAVNEGTILSTGVLVENGNSCAYVGGIAGSCRGAIGCENRADIQVETNGVYVGGITGYIYGGSQDQKVMNNINSGAISGKDSVGGIAGCVYSSYEVTNNENRNTVTGVNNVGGVFGESNGGSIGMSLLTNTAAVTGSATGSCTGGLIGKAPYLTLLTVCENTADITGGDYVGGFVGYAPKATIQATGAENNNTISGRYVVGGYAGEVGRVEYGINNGRVLSSGPNADGNTYLGGIAGYCYGAIGCVNNVDIEVENPGKYIGGIAGCIKVYGSNLANDNINNGKVVGGEYVGGIAGYLAMGTAEKYVNVTYTVSNNKNVGAVTGTDAVGGIFGKTYGQYSYGLYTPYYGYFEVINCTNEGEVTGTAYVGGIIGAYTYLKTDASVMDTNTTTHGEKLGQ